MASLGSVARTCDHDERLDPEECESCAAYLADQEAYWSAYFGGSIKAEASRRRDQRAFHSPGMTDAEMDNQDLRDSGRGHLVRGEGF